MGFLHVVRIAVAYKLVSIIGTEVHRYIKQKVYAKQTRNNSKNRWDYYLENELLKKYSKYLKSFGDIKLVPDFAVSGSIANIPRHVKIKVYKDDKVIATIDCENKPVIKKMFDSHYIDTEIVKFKVVTKNEDIGKANGNPMESTDERNNGEVEGDPSVLQRVSSIIGMSKRF